MEVAGNIRQSAVSDLSRGIIFFPWCKQRRVKMCHAHKFCMMQGHFELRRPDKMFHSDSVSSSVKDKQTDFSTFYCCQQTWSLHGKMVKEMQQRATITSQPFRQNDKTVQQCKMFSQLHAEKCVTNISVATQDEHRKTTSRIRQGAGQIEASKPGNTSQNSLLECASLQ